MTLANFDVLSQKYADLITSVGVNVQKGQDIVIYADVEQVTLVHKIVDSAYARGANNVVIEWQDIHIQREFLKHASEDSLTNIPAWVSVRAEELMGKHTTRISLISADPDGLGTVDGDRVSAYQQAYQRANQAVRKATMNNDVSWLVVAASGQAWAEKVFPELSGEAATDRLWEEIFKITRVGVENDVIADWMAHVNKLKEKAQWLNDLNFKELHYKSAVTDLTVGLAEDHLWEASDSIDKAGNMFVANMPTEEVFTSPDYRNIHGTVTSTKPLSYAGVLINDIKLTFENGHVVEAHASTGEAVLQQLIKTDEGASSLGEVSLVPDPSPISQSGIVFYNTLIDENASDHLALGAAYPFNLKGGTQMDVEARKAKGQNDSLVHVDFMMGSADMDIDGITFDGQVVPVFRNGDWA
ncbi:aminopeptidase [Weissella confusa]|uniref:aminopeptidase n=1 Tax=Weissella confusa TaxID=1583 RepID=UPI0018F132D3|nr:aminopeptidase [Weissella confusa]MBJ7617646.1 aminopeptidase [Weissella confusa]MBJ7651283.1 aminopeptidase [Weissella confusa]MBJ7657614.1 aminopeptidase [Weissella confusa]MBJ7665594.1 aminopeptidase [Weissella confusa]